MKIMLLNVTSDLKHKCLFEYSPGLKSTPKEVAKH